MERNVQMVTVLNSKKQKTNSKEEIPNSNNLKFENHEE
jgi:hypothetical protein